MLSLALLCIVTAGEPPCAAGQERSSDTAGHCCWPRQAWSTTQQLCVGLPECPQGLSVQGQGCAVVCAEGQTVGDETEGHCCWPSQVWSRTRSVCVGVPQCPAGFTAAGEQCTKPAAVLTPPAPPPAAPVTAAPPAATEVAAPAAPKGTHMEKKFRTSLITGGGILFGVGWFMGIATAIGGAIYSSAVPANTCWSSVADVGWVPFFGPAIAIGGLGSHHAENGKVCTDIPVVYAPGVAVAVVSTVAQFAGAALMVLGFTWRQEVLVVDEPTASRDGGGLEWGLHLGTNGAPLGLTFSLSHF